MMRSYLVLLLLLGACTQDGNQTKLQYMPDMADAPTVKPQLDYLEPPVGAVARDAILYPPTVEEAEKILQNPLGQVSPESPHFLNGKRLYEIQCTPCHGSSLKGDGSVTDMFPRPPDLTSGAYADRKPGFFFYRITFGSAIMPGYGHALDPKEIWEITSYVTSLTSKQEQK